jgi:hypothetical protein
MLPRLWGVQISAICETRNEVHVRGKPTAMLNVAQTMKTSPLHTIRIPASPLLLSALTSWLVLPALAGNATWDFNADPVYKTVTFSEISGGVTATFSQVPIPFQPSLFSVQNDGSVFGGPGWTPPSWGNYLFDGLPPTAAAHVLDITFSTPLTTFSFDFATALGTDPLGSPISVMLTTPVGSASASGALTGTTLPNGSLSFSSATPFSDVKISVPVNGDNIQRFIVDNIVVTTAGGPPSPSVPDQGVSPALAGGVMLALVLLARRQRKISSI